MHTRIRIAAPVLAGALALVPAPATAQEPADTVELRELVVTATRVPISRAAVTAAVTVLEGEELRTRGVDHVLEALRAVPGAAIVQSGAFGATTSLFLRGGESDYVQVLVDGVPVNAPGGSFDFATLTTDNVERIEVVRGPVSVLYGSDAVSGVVQVFTRDGAGPPRATLGVRGGSFGSIGWDASVSGGIGRAGYAFSFSRFHSDGLYDFNSDYRNTVLSGRVRLEPDDRTDASVSLRYTDYEQHYPTDSGGQPVDRNAFRFGDVVTLGVDLGRYLTDRFELRLRLAANETDGGLDDRADGPADTLGFFGFQSIDAISRRSADAQVNFHVSPATVLTVGAAVEEQQQRSFSESKGQAGPSSSTADFARRNLGAYAQALTTVAGHLSLNAGIRLDDNEAFGGFVTFRAGAAYRFPTGTRLRAAVGTAFKEPTFLENFGAGFVTGNPRLEPERSRSWEVGLAQELLDGRASFSATYFDQRFHDMIQFTFTPPNPGDPNYFNVAAATAAGIELTARLDARPGLALRGSYTYLDTEATDAGFDSGPDALFVEGDRLLRRPTHAGSLGLDWRIAERAAVHGTVQRVGERVDRDFTQFPATRVLLEPYTRIDVAGEYELFPTRGARPALDATLRVDNLLDAKYQEIIHFPAQGRTVFVGARLRFGG